MSEATRDLGERLLRYMERGTYGFSTDLRKLLTEAAAERSALLARVKELESALELADQNVAAFMQEPDAAVRVYAAEHSIERFKARRAHSVSRSKT